MFKWLITSFVKEIVRLKMKLCWKCSHSQAIQNVNEFVFHQNRFGENCHYITCSLMDLVLWMGAVRMRVQTSDKNITVIHTTQIHQLISCKVKSCVFARNIHQDAVTVNIASCQNTTIHNNLFHRNSTFLEIGSETWMKNRYWFWGF